MTLQPRLTFVSCVLVLSSAGQTGPLAQGIPMPGDPVDEGAAPMPGADSATLGVEGGAALEIGGYVEDTVTVEYSPAADHELLLNAIRSRLDLLARPTRDLEVVIGLVGTLYSGATEIEAVNYLPQGTARGLVQPSTLAGLPLPGTADLLTIEMENDLYLQEAFGALTLGDVRIRAGRQKIYAGTGYAFNPIDLFIRKNPLDPTYEVDGYDAVMLSLALPWQMELEGMVRFGDRLEHLDFQGRLAMFLGGWDVRLQFTQALRSRVDWEALDRPEAISALALGAPLDDFERQLRWRLVAADAVGQVGEAGVHAEGGWAFVDAEGEVGTLAHAEEDHARFLVGMDYTFTFQTYVLLEYLYLGQGRTERSQITLNDRMAALTGEVLAVDRNTLFAGISHPITDLTELAVYGIVGVDDPSATINPWLTANVASDYELSLSAYVPVGAEDSQVGRAGAGGFLRLKAHF